MIAEFLERLGLTRNEAEVYVALLSFGEATADEVSRKSGLSRPTVYNVLRSLVDKGLVAEVVKKPLRFAALPPRKALSELFQRKLSEIEKLREELPQQFSAFLEQAEELYRNVYPGGFDLGRDIVVLKGMKTVVDVMARIRSRVRKSVRVVARVPFVSSDDLQAIEDQAQAQAPPLEPAPVEFRLICESRLAEVPEFVELIGKIEEEEGIACRHVPTVDVEFTIYDDFAALLEIHDEGDLESCKVILIQNKQLVKLLIIAFEAMWEKASPFKPQS